jgi:hypothetical protein
MSDADIVNQALYLMGDKSTVVTGTPGAFLSASNPVAVAANYLYSPCVAAVARLFEWDFARNMITLTLSGNTGPYVGGYPYEYLYPTNGIELWQIIPGAAAITANRPLPTNWVVGNTLVSSVQKKVIWSNTINARLLYNNNPTPDVWDAGFREAVARRLASEFAVALAGRPETAQSLLESGTLAAQVARLRDA